MTASKFVWPLLALAVFLASCVMPTNYVAVLTVDRDTCRMEYTGQFQVDEALGGRVSESEAKAATLDAMKQLEGEVLQAGGSVTTSFVRNGFFDAVITLQETLGEAPKTLLYLVTVERDAKDRVTVRSFDASDEDRKDFVRQGLEGKGELRVMTKGTVLESNAQEKPGIVSRHYGWKLDLMQTGPAAMVIQF